MKVLVTGGCGFIGSHFIRLLLNERDYQVVNLDALTYAGNPENLADVAKDSRYEFVKGSISDPELVSRVMKDRFDAIVNFAAESHVDRSLHGLPTEFIRTNLEGTTILLNEFKRQGTGRFVQISTDEVYGDIETGAAAEDAPLRPNNPYSVTKAAADQMVLSHVRSFGINAVITRSANNYGPNQYLEKFIPVVVSKALRDEPIPVYGDGKQVRDWLYVEDNCRAILAVMEKGRPGQIYNIGADSHHANIDVARLILANLRKPESLIRFVGDRPGHDRRYAVDWRRIKTELGWSPRTAFEGGLWRTIDWYRWKNG